MLEEIHIRNFAIIDEQTVSFASGFNVMSGETGAGKSILIDALGLQLGDRAESGWIRHGTSRCDIQSTFSYPADSPIADWLAANEFDQAHDNGCQLRRTLSDNSKSRCYINGIPTTVGNTKQLSEMLVDIHGQHAHQSLLHPEKQLALLDHFANHKALQSAVKTAYQHWQKLLRQQKQLQDDDTNLNDKRELLHYQLDELTALDLHEGEFEQLSEEQKQLSAASDKLTHVNTINFALDGDNSVSRALTDIIATAEQINAIDAKASEIGELFNQALIYIDEGHSALGHYAQSIELDPERLAEVEQRMGILHDMSRKHRTTPDQLIALQADIEQQLKALDAAINTLTAQSAGCCH